MPCQCAYCLHPQKFAWLSNGQIKPDDSPYFHYPMYTRIRIGDTNIVAVLEGPGMIRFNNNKLKQNWQEATKFAYLSLNKAPSKSNKSIDQWPLNSTNHASLWTINVMMVGSISMDMLDTTNKFVGNGPRLDATEVIACTDTDCTINYELATHPLFAHSKALQMFDKVVRQEIMKLRNLKALSTAAPIPSSHAESIKRGGSSKRKKITHVESVEPMETSDHDDDEEDAPAFSWTIDAPADEWDAVNVSKYIQGNNKVPILRSIDRTFKRFGVAIEFMDVRMLHPRTNEEVKLTLSSALLFHVAAYQDDVKRELDIYRSMN